MNDSLVNTTHKTRPWRDVSYAIAAPGRDRGKANVGYLAAGFMRVLDNTQHNSDGVLQIANMGREAIEGANFKRGMMRTAWRTVQRHERYKNRLGGLERLYEIAMKGLG